MQSIFGLIGIILYTRGVKLAASEEIFLWPHKALKLNIVTRNSIFRAVSNIPDEYKNVKLAFFQVVFKFLLDIYFSTEYFHPILELY